jgi:uncharacterized phage protein (TIGR01671 family)
MNRTIKFRGQRTDNGEWVYGLLERTGYKFFIYDYNDIRSRIDENTVGQFTGLLDMNGKEIYEGDILDFEGKIFPVKYYVPLARFNTTNDGAFIGVRTWDETEIVGNVYDNPELLK